MTSGAAGTAFDVAAVRAALPILDRLMADDHPLVYLDSANTSQKPRPVIDAMVQHYEWHNANVARAVHQLGAESTEAFEAARDKVAAFVGAPHRDEIVFTSNASAGLNLVANVLVWAGQPLGIRAGDEVVITEMEHHSNIVPWQLACERTGGRVRRVGVTAHRWAEVVTAGGRIKQPTERVLAGWGSPRRGHRT